MFMARKEEYNFFQHMHEKGSFSAQKSESKIEVFERLARSPAVARGKVLCLPLYDDSICPISDSLFMQRRSYFCTYYKITMCNKGEIDFFRLG